MSEKIVTVELDILFVNGERELFFGVEGVDIFAMDAERIKLVLHPEPRLPIVEEVIITRSAVARLKTTKKELKPAPEMPEGLKMANA